MNPPARKPLDRAKYREQYINNLKLETSNNQMNLNANQIFKNTGQTPSQLADTRTTTEKFADLEHQKIDLRANLQEITDGTNASQIVNELTPVEITFATSQIAFILDDLKPKWTMGIPADAFLVYLRSLKRKYEQTNGVDFGLQQRTGEQILLSQQQILGQLANPAQLHQLNQALGHVHGYQALVQAVREELRLLQALLPTQQKFQRLAQMNPETQVDIHC
jgi:hypothetical protein